MSEAESKRIFQKKFNALLTDRQITQKEIAAVCGVSTSTVSTWSKGLNMPRMDKIETLANYFGILKSDLIEDRAPTTPTPVSGDGRSEMEQMIYERLSRLTPENQEIALAQLDVLLKHQDKQENG